MWEKNSKRTRKIQIQAIEQTMRPLIHMKKYVHAQEILYLVHLSQSS